jgi:hypothetical protein
MLSKVHAGYHAACADRLPILRPAVCPTDTTRSIPVTKNLSQGLSFVLLCAILTGQTNCSIEDMGRAVFGLAIIAGVFAVNVYRAAHQSITADEAFTWDFYIDKPFNWFLVVYSTNNHALHTLLCRITVKALGLSELTLRLPSLAGGLLYLVSVYQLCRLLFKQLWTFFLALVGLTLNPFIADYLSAARGYGMGLGFFTAALYLVIRFFDDEPNAANLKRVTWAAILLGLSISANIIFIFPAIVLAGTLALLQFSDTQPGTWRQRALWSMGRIWLPLLASPVLFLAIPLAHSQNSDFYTYGKGSLSETALSLVQRSLFHQYNVWTAGRPPDVVDRSSEIVAIWVVPSMLAILLAALVATCLGWLRVRRFRQLSQLDRAFFLITGVLAMSIAALVAAHYGVGMFYPIDRTAIYLATLMTLAWVAMIEKSAAWPRWTRVLASTPMVLAVALFLAGFTTSHYYDWRYDAGTKRIFRLLEQQHRFDQAKQVRVGVDWKLDFSFNFYRTMYHADWLAKVLRTPPPEAGGYDYYVVFPDEWEPMRDLGLRVVYRDPVSGQILAEPAVRLAE